MAGGAFLAFWTEGALREMCGIQLLPTSSKNRWKEHIKTDS